jgi:hypothetical protein
MLQKSQLLHKNELMMSNETQIVSLVCQLLQELEGTSIAKALVYYGLSLNFVCFGFLLS